MSDTLLASIIAQVAAVAAISGIALLPYVLSQRARVDFRYCVMLAIVEAVLLFGWYVLGSAIVTPVTGAILFQGAIAGSVLAVVVLLGWLVFLRLKGDVHG